MGSLGISGSGRPWLQPLELEKGITDCITVHGYSEATRSVAELHCRDGRNVSSAAHSQATINESSHNRSGSTQSVSSALTCQLSCNVTAALQTVEFGSNWSAELQFGSSAATFPANSKCQLRCKPSSLACLAPTGQLSSAQLLSN